MPSITIIYAEKFMGVVNRTRGFVNEWTGHAHLQEKTKEVFEVVRKITDKKATRVHTVQGKHGVSLTDQQVKNRCRWRDCTIRTLSLTRQFLVNF